MPELLLELFSEEIPARFQRRAAEDLKKAVTNALIEAGLVYESARAFVTPRGAASTATAAGDSREGGVVALPGSAGARSGAIRWQNLPIRNPGAPRR